MKLCMSQCIIRKFDYKSANKLIEQLSVIVDSRSVGSFSSIYRYIYYVDQYIILHFLIVPSADLLHIVFYFPFPITYCYVLLM